MPAPTAISDLFTDWCGFEKFIAELHKTGSVVVEHNVTLIGKSGASRQIDVLIRHKEGLYEHLIVVECKFRKSPIKREHVDALANTIQEVGASKGAIFSIKGFQRGAIEQAKHENIGLYKVRELEDDEWGKPGRNIDLWLHVVTISVGAFAAPGSMCVGSPPTGPLSIALDNSSEGRSSQTPLCIPGQAPTTLEALLIDTARKSARAIYKPCVINFEGIEEGNLKHKIKVQIKPKIAAEVLSMGAVLLFPEMTYELGLMVAQSRIQIDRGSDYGFVLAVEDCVSKTMTIASRAAADEHTSFKEPRNEFSHEEVYQNGSIATIWLNGMSPFEEFADVPLSADIPLMEFSLSSASE